jgi:hypothetical protein
MGRNDEARQLYDRACRITPHTPLAIFKKAKSLYRDRLYEVFNTLLIEKKKRILTIIL